MGGEETGWDIQKGQPPCESREEMILTLQEKGDYGSKSIRKLRRLMMKVFYWEKGGPDERDIIPIGILLQNSSFPKG